MALGDTLNNVINISNCKSDRDHGNLTWLNSVIKEKNTSIKEKKSKQKLNGLVKWEVCCCGNKFQALQ